MKKTVKELKEILAKLDDATELYLYSDFFVTKERTSNPLSIRLSDSNYGYTLNIIIEKLEKKDRIAILDSCEDNDSCNGLMEVE